MKSFFISVFILCAALISLGQENDFYEKADSFINLFHELEPLVEPELEMFENIVEKLSTLTVDYTQEEAELVTNLMNLAYVRLAYAYSNFHEFLKHSSFLPDEDYLVLLYGHKKRVKKIIDDFEYRTECAFCRFAALTIPGHEDKNKGCRKCFKEEKTKEENKNDR